MTSRKDSTANIDARRNLGVRPGGLPPPRVFVDDAPHVDVPLSPSIRAPPSPKSPTTSRNVSIAIPGDMEPSSQPSSPLLESARRFRRPTLSSKQRTGPRVDSTNRGLYETQKLLSHMLDKLENRSHAPDILERAAISARNVSNRDRGRVKGKAGKLGHAIAAPAHSAAGPSTPLGIPFHPASGTGRSGIASEDLEDKAALEAGESDTEAVYDLIEQALSLLILADKQGLDLFSGKGKDSGISGLDATPVKHRRKTGRFPSMSPVASKPSFSFPQPNEGRGESSPHNLHSSVMSGVQFLERTLSVLHSLLTVDCLHRTHKFRPSCPPYALQIACLHVASQLYKKNATSIRIRLVGMVIDSLYSMGPMVERVCEWLEPRLEELLRELSTARGGPRKAGVEDVDSMEWTDPFSSKSAPGRAVPTFAISTDSQDTLPVQVASPGWRKFTPSDTGFPFSTGSAHAGLLSTHAGATTSVQAVKIATLVPRILLAVTSIVDLSAAKLSTIHRVHRLLSLVLTAKPDAALDLLEIVAYAPVGARRTALEVMSTFFPEVMGHNVISRRFASITYAVQRTKWETGQEKALGEDETEGHVFLPCRFSSQETPGPCPRCSTCGVDIRGFVLRCSRCGGHRHLHCYNPSEEVFRYDVVKLSSEGSLSQMFHVKFGTCPPRLDEQVLYGSTPRGQAGSTKRRVGQHALCLVNLFNLTLCDGCHLPLWGTSRQAYACSTGCQRLYHPSCVDGLADGGRSLCRPGHHVVIDDISAGSRNPFSITRSELAESFKRDMGWLVMDDDEVTLKTFDELAVIYGVLWIQYQILKSGLSAGSIHVTDGDSMYTEASAHKDAGSDMLNLKALLSSYGEHMQSRDKDISAAASDFAHISGLDAPLDQGYIFSDRYLTYVTALLRAPSGVPTGGLPQTPSDGLLTPLGMPDAGETEPSGTTAYEALPLPVLVSTLASDLGIRASELSAAFLNQLCLAGLITIPRLNTITPDQLDSSSIWASFTLPLLMDSSPTVELLIAAIETLLDDLDLTMNEQGLRLLRDRAWPSLLCSPYALERLARSVMAWVMAEDETLLQIVKLFASRHKRLPGVRAATSAGPNGDKASTSVNAYKESRERLLHAHVQPWLAALHDQDPALYAAIVYDECKDSAAAALPADTSDQTDTEVASRIAGVALERMTAVANAGVIFTTSMDLLTAWLEDLGTLADQDVAYRSLPRLLRSSTPTDQSDIFSLSRSVSLDGSEGFERVCRWMRVLAYSGVEIPWPTLLDLVELQSNTQSGLDSKLDLIIAVGANGSPIEPEDFARLCDKIAMSLFEDCTRTSGDRELSSSELDLIRQAVLLLLRAYGVPLDQIMRTSLGTSDMQEKQPASLDKRRRTTSTRAYFALTPRVVWAAAALIEHTSIRPELVLDLLWLLFNHATMVDNIDGFIHRNCLQLFRIRVWPLGDRILGRRSRMRVILRMISVDSIPLETIVRSQLDSKGERPLVRERLLTFALDLADHTVIQDNTGWRKSAVGLILLLFDAILDTTEILPDNLLILKALLPTHLAAMSACFEEFLIQGSDERRAVLLARLQRLRLALPTWPIVSWKVIEDLLVEQGSTIAQIRPGRSPQTTSALLDAQAVRSALIALGLDLLAAGVPISWTVAQRFQQHVASSLSTPWAAPVESLTAMVLPALRAALDSSSRITISGQSFESKTKRTTLVGALFVPVIMDLAGELAKRDFLTQKVLLDALMVTFFKQNVRPVELAALSTLQTLALFVVNEPCAENRLLALQILQTALVKMDRDNIARTIPSAFAAIAGALVKESDLEYGDPLVVEQCRVFLYDIIKSFGKSGLFLQLFRLDFTTLPGGPVCLATAMASIQTWAAFSGEADRAAFFDNVFLNLSDVFKRGKDVLDHVLGALCLFTQALHVDLTEEAALSFGGFIVRLSKHVAEWNANEFDPNAILETCAFALGLVPPSSSIMLLHQCSTLLHLCLTRFGVALTSLDSLLDAAGSVAKAGKTEDTVRTVVYELVGSALHGLNVTPITMHALLSFSARERAESTISSIRKSSVLSDSAAGCVQVLVRTHPMFATSHRPNADISLDIMVQAGTVLCRAEMMTTGAIARSLVDITSEAVSTQVNLFMYILLASLDVPMCSARSRITSLYPILARAASLCLRASTDFLTLQDTTGDGAELLSAVFAVFRLSVLALTDPAEKQQANESKVTIDEDTMDMLWCRIWPDWYRLLTLSFDSTCINGPLRAVAHSIFLDTLIFLGATHSPILSRHASVLVHALAMLARQQETGPGSTSGKLQKATQVLDGVVSGSKGAKRIDRQKHVDSVRKDLIATERLRALRAAG
ncbi:hypothetical protein IAU60_003614 [Kwoniella sp. DSM 27419]